MSKNLKKLTMCIGALAMMSLLGACATQSAMQGATTNAAASKTTATATGSKFCHKERLYDTGGEMVCNWAGTAADACRDIVPASRISKALVEGEPINARRCESGQWLVQVSMK